MVDPLLRDLISGAGFHMKLNRLFSTLFATTLLTTGLTGALAQDAKPAVKEPVAKETPAPAVQSPTPQVVETEELTHWRLKGGGEIVGELVKETQRDVFVDIGSSIISVPVTDVITQLALSKLDQTADDHQAGKDTSEYDPETGTLIFKNRNQGEKILSQQEVLDRVKQSVVLVSNPGGLGTGWIIDDSGRLITNHHVVGEETWQTVTLFVKGDDDHWEKVKIENCKVEAFSSLLDIAIVQLDMEQVEEKELKLYPIEIAKSGSLEAGDGVYAVGNPGMGWMVLEHSISEGIVSSLARNFNDVVYLQTTAAVNPGNSGGPLVNSQGQVVGLVTLKAIFQEGVAFALPVDYIHQFLKYSNAFAINDMSKNKGFRYHRPQ